MAVTTICLTHAFATAHRHSDVTQRSHHRLSFTSEDRILASLVNTVGTPGSKHRVRLLLLWHSAAHRLVLTDGDTGTDSDLSELASRTCTIARVCRTPCPQLIQELTTPPTTLLRPSIFGIFGIFGMDVLGHRGNILGLPRHLRGLGSMLGLQLFPQLLQSCLDLLTGRRGTRLQQRLRRPAAIPPQATICDQPVNPGLGGINGLLIQHRRLIEPASPPRPVTRRGHDLLIPFIRRQQTTQPIHLGLGTPTGPTGHLEPVLRSANAGLTTQHTRVLRRIHLTLGGTFG
ncbi:hypothetical protein, partial [Corynebacterium variabile]|uniref:hypothetical protein n=1 Tax=Corynebacterium variabile TaxID=1727 RepID=UPI001476B9ED